MNKLDQFDFVAGSYDRLASIVFGKALVNAQTCFLNLLPQKGDVLIIGGGTGWIANEILLVREDARIDYIEASGEMIRIAREKTAANSSKINFVYGTEDDIPVKQYDVVVTNFYFDLFREEVLNEVISKIKPRLKHDSNWFVADFQNPGMWWQKILLKVMYWFFRITARVEADQLPLWEKAIERHGLREISVRTFYWGFIKSVVYTNG